VDLHERKDRHGHLEDEAHTEYEDGDERDVVSRSELVLDVLLAEIDEELDRVRQQDEIAEQHTGQEEADHRQSHEADEAPLLREERWVDIRVDLVEDHRHGERDPREQGDPEVRREVLGRTERDQSRRWRVARVCGDERAVHRDDQDADERCCEEERDRRRGDERDGREHQTVPQLA